MGDGNPPCGRSQRDLSHLPDEALQVGVIEVQGEDTLRELHLLPDHHRLSPLAPPADIRPGRVVENLVGLGQEAGNVRPAKRIDWRETTHRL